VIVRIEADFFGHGSSSKEHGGRFGLHLATTFVQSLGVRYCAKRG